MSHTARRIGFTTLLALAALLSLAASASAAKQRPFKEVLGSAGEVTTLSWPSLVAVDPTTGDVLVGDASPGGSFETPSISRFKPNGEPDPFPALGTNVIDGKRGPGGHTRGECETAPEPASCDETPQNGIEVQTEGGRTQQIAVSPVTGDIFISQAQAKLVDIFSPEGRYLGQLTKAGTKSFSQPRGVAVDAAGAVYVTMGSSGGEISRFVPSGNPPVNSDSIGNLKLGSTYNAGHLAFGSGPSAGRLFAGGFISGNNSINTLDIDPQTGSFHVYAENFSRLVTVDPNSGNPIIGALNNGKEAAEFDGGAESVGAPLSRLFYERSGVGISDFAANAAGDLYMVIGPGDPRVVVYGPPVVVPTVTAQPASEITTNEATLNGTIDPEGLGVEDCRFEARLAGVPRNESQRLTPAGASGGTFTLGFEGQTTSALPYGASETEVETALEALPAIGAGGVFVNHASEGPYVGTYVVSFMGALADTDVPQLEVDASGLTPTGATIEVTTETQGHQGWDNAWVLPCLPEAGDIPTGSGPQQVEARLTGLKANGTEYLFRLRATDENGTETSGEETFLTAHGVTTEPATVTGRHTATLNGTIRPEGLQYEECFFKWGLASNEASYEHTASCEPEAGEIPPDSAAHAVKADVTGLEEGTEYRFRLFAKPTGEGLQEGAERDFETFGPLSIEALRASNASQSAVSLEAEINPHGIDTSYRFEWGPTTSYGHFAPVEFKSIGHGTAAVQATARIAGLAEASTYHFRVVAESEAGSQTSEDQTAETLDSCGLPDGRCFELVSRRDAGPTAVPGEFTEIGLFGVTYQAARSGPGGLVYPVESGYPDATKGSTAFYLARREAGSQVWGSTQLIPPVIGQNQKGNGANSSASAGIGWVAADLSCSFTQSWRLLTEDPAMRLAYESGKSNIYRINPDGTYTPVTYLAPENPESANNSVIAGSQSCSKLVFASPAHYPGIPSNGSENLYEWEEGTLRNAGWVPGPSGDVAVAANGSGAGVSSDGSRVFFTAKRLIAGHAGNAKEVGKTGLFVREDGTTTRDVSASETSTADEGAAYKWSTADGSKVFFTANAGLTAESSAAGTDLYEYDLGSEALRDLSASSEAGGAKVQYFLGASEDGKVVYFAASGQLLAGRGRTLAQNESAGSLSIYRAAGGELSFVATVGADTFGKATEASPEGRYLAFESRANVTGYESGGWPEAYLYDAGSGAEGKTVCVSCRPDGEPSVGPVGGTPLQDERALPSLKWGGRILTVSGGQAHLFFNSYDGLAPGAIEGQNNVYEFSHGQVFRLTSERGRQTTHSAAFFAGASDDGSDAYLFTPETLTWEDGDGRISVYDARIGGGFPEPPAPAAPCDPDTEGSCQGTPGAVSAATPGAATKDYSGPGNVSPRKHKAAPKKKHHKKNRKHHHGKKKSKRGAKSNRRAHR